MHPSPSGEPDREPRRLRRTNRRTRKPRRSGKRSGNGVGGFIGAALLVVLSVVAVAVIVGVIGSYTFLPGMISERIAASVRDDLGLNETPRAEVRSDPPPEMLLGRFSGSSIGIGADELWGFNVQSVNVELDEFDVDVLASLMQGAIVYEDEPSASIEAVVSSEEVGRVAMRESNLEGVRLANGQLVVEQDPQLIGDVRLPIEVRGDLSLRGGDALVYTPSRVSVAGVSLPENTVEEILSGVELTFPIENASEGVALRSIDISGDTLVLSGDVQEFQ